MVDVEYADTCHKVDVSYLVGSEGPFHRQDNKLDCMDLVKAEEPFLDNSQ